MLSEIEVVAEMLFATYYSKAPEDRKKLTKDWNRTFLLKIKEYGNVLAKVENGELSIQTVESESDIKYDLLMESDIETFTKFTVYKSTGKKDWLKRFWNLLTRKVKFKPMRKIRDAMRLAKIMGV
ncbi:MAG: hypothetical protein ACTSQI_03415 [Candidatus Helarchaeota archaeon]